MPIIIPVVLALIIAGGSYLYLSTPAPDTAPEPTDITRSPEAEQDEMTSTPTETEPTEPTTSTDTDTPTRAFTATAGYQTPARTSHEIAVTLTVDEDGIITDAAVAYDGTPGYSNANQERFDAVYKNEVVGTSLNEVSLSRVGGASLTSGAFNEAVAQIATQQNS